MEKEREFVVDVDGGGKVGGKVGGRGKGGGDVPGGIMESLISCVAPLLMGYCLGFSSPSLADIQQHFGLSLQAASLFSSVILVGAFIGCSLGGSWAGSQGRKATISISLGLTCVGWGLHILSSPRSSTELLFLGRFMCGVGFGVGAVAVPIYINEMAPKKYRETLGACHQLFITIGIMSVYILGNYIGWTSLSFVGMLLSAGGWLAFSIWCKGLLRGGNRWAVLKAIGLMFFQQWSGVNIVIFFASFIFSSAGFTNLSRSAPVVMAVFQVIFTVISVYIISPHSQKGLLLTGSIAMGASLLLLSTFFLFHGTENEIPGAVAVFSLAVYVSGFSVSWGPIPWLKIPSILPPQIKAEGMSLSILVSYISAFIIVQSFPVLESLFGTGLIFIFYAVCCFAAAGFVLIDLL